MFGLLNSAFNVVKNVTEVVVTPVEMLVDLADAATKPLADVAKDLKNEVKSLKD